MLSVSEKLLSRIERSDHVALGCDSGIVYVSRQALPLAMYARSTMNYTLIQQLILSCTLISVYVGSWSSSYCYSWVLLMHKTHWE